MPATQKSIAPAMIAEARRLYEETDVPVADIAALLGLSEIVFARRRRLEWKWKPRRYSGEQLRAFRRRRAEAATRGARADPAGPDARLESSGQNARAAPTDSAEETPLGPRIHAAVRRQLLAVESILKAIGPSAPDDPERAARILASVSRTLQEAMRLDVPALRTPEPKVADEPPADLDELRRELSRRLDALAAEPPQAVPREP